MILPPPADLEAFHRGEPVRVRVRMEPQPPEGTNQMVADDDWLFWAYRFGGGEEMLSRQSWSNPLGPPDTRHGVREEWALPPDYDPERHGGLEAKPRIGPVCVRSEYPSWEPWQGTVWRDASTMPDWAVRTWATVVTPEPPERDADGWWWVAMVRKETALRLARCAGRWWIFRTKSPAATLGTRAKATQGMRRGKPTRSGPTIDPTA